MPSHIANRKIHKGFTLIELVVVLFILVGLAALIIPAVSGLVGRTTASTSASSIGNVANSIQRYEAQYLTYPNNFDSLMTNLVAGTILNTLDPALATASSLTGATEDLVLSTALLVPLTAAGISNVGDHAVDDGSYQLAASTTLLDTMTLRGLKAATQVALGLERTGAVGKYVVLGVGSITDMKGRTMVEPPVAFPSDGSINPNTTYRRFIAIFQITDGTNPLNRAKLVGILSPDASSVSTELGNYFALVDPNN